MCLIHKLYQDPQDSPPAPMPFDSQSFAETRRPGAKGRDRSAVGRDFLERKTDKTPLPFLEVLK